MAQPDALTAYHDQLMAEVRNMLDARVEQAVTSALARVVKQVFANGLPAPTVNVAQPHVAVAPNINIPDIRVEIPESPEIEINVDMAAYARELGDIKILLAQIAQLLSQPEVTDIERSSGGFITRATRHR